MTPDRPSTAVRRFVLVAPPHGTMRRLLEILDLTALAPVCDTREQALAASGGAADRRSA